MKRPVNVVVFNVFVRQLFRLTMLCPMILLCSCSSSFKGEPVSQLQIITLMDHIQEYGIPIRMDEVILNETSVNSIRLHAYLNFLRESDSGVLFKECWWSFDGRLLIVWFSKKKGKSEWSAIGTPRSSYNETIDDNYINSSDRHIQELFASKGTPKYISEFRPEIDNISEFRVGIYNHYPPGADVKNVLIKEYIWHYPGLKEAYWFHNIDGVWVLLNTIEWNKEEF